MRIIGILLTTLGILAIIGETMGIAFPTARWFFTTSREVPWLHTGTSNGFQWFGWLSSVSALLCGLTMLIRSFSSAPPNPLTRRRIQRFREIKRGYYSLIIICSLAGIAALDQTVVGKRALAVKHDDTWTFPAFRPSELKNKDFGITGKSAEAPANYRKLKQLLEGSGQGRVIMPLIPFDPTGDTLPTRSKPLNQSDDTLTDPASGKPFFGLGARFHDVIAGRIHIRYTLRNGALSGPAVGWDESGGLVYSADYQDGRLIKQTYSGNGSVEDFINLPTSAMREVKYHPAPPMPAEDHWLGTNSQGYDVLAYLFGGLQVNFKAALVYVPAIYMIGVIVGLLMGYFGGWFDLAIQRLIEIFSNIPFLFVVIIFSSMVPEAFKGLPIILTILIAFGWMSMTYLMRTAAYRDKERDYISAARVMGAGTPRILIRHLLPNTAAIIVTLVPFTMSGLIFALTALDYLGFGLPPDHATWGRLLNDGLANLSAPWLVTSTFTVLVALLVLITFIGEAVREAFDPKKFTYYR